MTASTSPWHTDTPPLDYVHVDQPDATKIGAFFIAFFIAGLLMGGLLTSLVSA